MSVNIDSELIALIFGGGGVALLTALGKLIKDWQQGRVLKEDNAITYYQTRVHELESENRELDRKLSVYRRAYAELWRVYRIGPPPGKVAFPFDPIDFDPSEHGSGAVRKNDDLKEE